jgi:hypothetical protein
VYELTLARYEGAARSWLDILGLDLLALPYILLARLLTLNWRYDLAYGAHPGHLWWPAVVCAGMVYVTGWRLERWGRAFFGRF